MAAEVFGAPAVDESAAKQEKEDAPKCETCKVVDYDAPFDITKACDPKDCIRCRLMYSVGANTAQARKLLAKGEAADCQWCNKSYKFLTRRWGKDSSWKTWWDLKTGESKVLWYRDKRKIGDLDDEAVEKNKRRKVSVQNETTKVSGQVDDIEVLWKPWLIMRRDMKTEGFETFEAQQKEWRRRCMDASWLSRKVMG